MRNGFTLVEALVVLAIVVLITALGWPAFDRARVALDWRAAQGTLVATAAAAHAAAQAHDRVARLTTSPDGRAVLIDGQVAGRFADGIALALVPATLDFHADGSASAGRLALTGPAGSHRWRLSALNSLLIDDSGETGGASHAP